MKALLVPVACYLGMTLVVPLADGRHGARFAEHGAMVLGVVFVVVSFVLLLGRACRGGTFPRWLRSWRGSRA